MDDFEVEIKQDFLAEAEGLLETAEQILLRLEGSPNSVDDINELFRIAHNIKGSSKAVGFETTAEFTHHYENLLLKLKSNELEYTDENINLLLEGRDCISEMISGLKSDLEAQFDNSTLIKKIETALSGQASTAPLDEVAPEQPSTAPIEMAEQSQEPHEPQHENHPLEDESVCNHELLKELMGELGAKDSITPEAENTLESLAEPMPEVPDASAFESPLPAPSPQPPIKTSPASRPAPAEKPKTSPKHANEDDNIRVKLSRVEKLNNVVGELVILHTVLDQRRFVAIQDEAANKTIAQLGKLSKEIQEIAMGLRMIPVKPTFQKMNRIVRDTSKSLGKKVNFQLEGEDTEIDKTVLEQIGDPLVHIIRNAIDHGLETPEERLAAGKNEAGNVTLRAYHEGSQLVLETRDDGKGINPEIIRKKAIEKNLLSDSTSISDEDIIQYIFHAGFSTKEQVTDVSGRGVGMDVVKTNIESLSGKVRVHSKVGEGSVFQIVLPLTLAIIEGMVVESGDQRYVIPLTQVHESILPTPGSIHNMKGVGKCLKLRGDVIPIANLSTTLGNKSRISDEHKQIAIISRNSECSFAVQVDDIVKQQQVVIKSLGSEIRNKKGYMGSSILGDGRPAIILDLHELYEATLLKTGQPRNGHVRRAQ